MTSGTSGTSGASGPAAGPENSGAPGPAGATVRICPLADLSAGDALRVDTDALDGSCPPIAVFHTDDGRVFAIDDTCTHQDASLADGWLDGATVECPLHSSCFDLRTGEVDAPPARVGVRAHRAEVIDGQIWVTLSTAEPRLPPGVSFLWTPRAR